jgi:hypothetical protein
MAAGRMRFNARMRKLVRRQAMRALHDCEISINLAGELAKDGAATIARLVSAQRP